MILNTTLLETNIDRDNQSLGQYIPFGRLMFRGYLSFREGKKIDFLVTDPAFIWLSIADWLNSIVWTFFPVPEFWRIQEAGIFGNARNFKVQQCRNTWHGIDHQFTHLNQIADKLRGCSYLFVIVTAVPQFQTFVGIGWSNPLSWGMWLYCIMSQWRVSRCLFANSPEHTAQPESFSSLISEPTKKTPRVSGT